MGPKPKRTSKETKQGGYEAKKPQLLRCSAVASLRLCPSRSSPPLLRLSSSSGGGCVFASATRFTKSEILASVSAAFRSIAIGVSKIMDTQKSQSEKQSPSVSNTPSVTSCRTKKSEEATFLQDVKDHIDEFIHASMDEHKTCFKKTVQKMFGLSKVVAQRNSDAAKEVESSLPLRTTQQD